MHPSIANAMTLTITWNDWIAMLIGVNQNAWLQRAVGSRVLAKGDNEHSLCPPLLINLTRRRH